MVSTLRTPCAADQLLIEEVRQHEVLYACPTKSNKDNQLRDTAWQEIADAVGKSGQFVFFSQFYHLALSSQKHICLVKLTHISFYHFSCCCFEKLWWWIHTVEEAKERWRYMRDKYVKELGRNDKYRATNGGSIAEPPDATSFVGLMSFLNPFIKRKSSNG